MTIIKYDDLIIKENSNKYRILFNDNINTIVIQNENSLTQIQFKLTIKGFNFCSLENND